jgi:hypothetical protein
MTPLCTASFFCLNGILLFAFPPFRYLLETSFMNRLGPGWGSVLCGAGSLRAAPAPDPGTSGNCVRGIKLKLKAPWILTSQRSSHPTSENAQNATCLGCCNSICNLNPTLGFHNSMKCLSRSTNPAPRVTPDFLHPHASGRMLMRRA